MAPKTKSKTTSTAKPAKDAGKAKKKKKKLSDEELAEVSGGKTLPAKMAAMK